MKQIKLFTYLLLAGLSVVFTSCGDDIIDLPGTTNGPQVILVDEIGYTSDDVTLAPSATFTLKVDATAGDAEMNVYSMTADGVTLDPSRYTVNGTNPGSTSNLLFDTERTAFTYEVVVTAQADKSTQTYAFVVTDANGDSGSASLIVDTNAGGGTDVPVFTVTGPTSANLDPNSLHAIKMSATPQNNGQLASIAVYENDVLISTLTRLDFETYDFDGNPFVLPAEFRDGFSDKTLFLRTQASGNSIYRIVITDEFGNSSSFTKTISVSPTGTPVTTDLGVLLNQAGPAGTGGLDLDTGDSTGSTNAAADIRDMGIDGGPVATNWLQQIATVNGSSLRQLIPGSNGLLEGFTFASVTTIEAIADLYQNNAGPSLSISGTVLVGDFFVVESAGKFFLLEVASINNTTNDNNDSYTFNIKR